MPPEVLGRLLAVAGEDLVLIGGQALAFWMDRYGVVLAENQPAVSRDADFLTVQPDDRAAVHRMAVALAGHSLFPNERSLTALVGQAIRQLDAETYLNVDVLFQVYGTKSDRVRNDAIEVELEAVTFRVMHPLHVLKSRLDNLYGLAEKQSRLGELQLIAAIEVARHAQSELARQGAVDATVRRSPTLAFAMFVAKLAKCDAGRKVADRCGIHVADAIEPALIREPNFHRYQWPRLQGALSAARRSELAAGANSPVFSP